jgi:hypothetical protein
MIEPMRELGIMNLMVTARLPGTEALSNGSSFILRTMSPNAWQIVSIEAWHEVMERWIDDEQVVELYTPLKRHPGDH